MSDDARWIDVNIRMRPADYRDLEGELRNVADDSVIAIICRGVQRRYLRLEVGDLRAAMGWRQPS